MLRMLEEKASVLVIVYSRSLWINTKVKQMIEGSADDPDRNLHRPGTRSCS